MHIYRDAGALFSISTAPSRPSIRTVTNRITFTRQASMSTQVPLQSVGTYQIPKWTVHAFVPFAVVVYGFLRLSAPETQPGQISQAPTKADPTCKEVHASDLDTWIKAHPKEIQDDHAIGWNKMYTDYMEEVRKDGEPARVQAEYAKQLAAYAQKEENIRRSTKEKGRMSTLSANTNIGHRPTTAEALEDELSWSFSESIAQRMAQMKKRLTRASKGHMFGDN